MIAPKTTLSIDGQFLFNFQEVTLSQSINEHHTFTITLDYDSVETVGAYTIDKSREWLGKYTVINFNDTEFLGLITHVKLKHDNGFDGKLVVTGHSKTILLDNGTHLQSWLGKNLTDIITDTVNAIGIEAEINPVFNSIIEYQTQYNENHFQFIQRMAKQYNEWLYYDGVQLIFGKPRSLNDPINIEYGADMDTINLDIKTITSSANNFSYNALTNSRFESKTKGEVIGLNELGDYAFETSKELFSINTNGYSSTRIRDKSEIDKVVKNKQASKVATANVLSGTSTKQGLTVGSVIKVTAAQRGIGVFDIKNYGEYIITKIKHKATGLSEYSNEFEALSAGIAILPEPEVALPEAHSQIATVLSNEDPSQKGRVQVQFQWQTGHMKTAWLRVMTPDAGSSNSHNQNRGHVFIPEVDDQVMIGFRYNDPNRPFVMGSLFNGRTGAGGKSKNNVKSIITKSGNEVIFDDGDGKGSVHLNAPSGNSFHLKGDGSISVFNASGNHMLMDSQGNIDVTAPNHITFNSKKVTFNVADQMRLNVMQKMMVNTPWLMQLVTDLYHTQAGKALLTSENEIKIESPELYATGQKKLFLHSDEVATLNSRGIAEFKGYKGNKTSNVAEEYIAVTPEIEAKAVVHFRPHLNWAGEFGFDWMRTQDTIIDGDFDYKTNVGSYTGTDSSGKVIPATKSGAVFTPGNSFDLEKVYNPINITGKIDAAGNQIKYYTPWLSIYREPEATTAPSAEIELNITVEIAPDELYIEYPKKYFEVSGGIVSPTDENLMQLKLSASNHAVTTTAPHQINIVIKCIHTLEQDKFIRAYAVKNKADGTVGDPKLAGRLKVKANSKIHRRVAKIVFVNVVTQINNAKKQGIFPADEVIQETYLTPFLQQALVNSIRKSEPLNLWDTTKREVQYLNNNYTRTYRRKKVFTTTHNTRSDTLATFLEQQFDAIAANSIYKNHYKVFFIGELGKDFDGANVSHVGGYANGLKSKECVMYANPDKFFVSHELMHCMGLSHSFDNKSKHTFEIGKTENIMDYSHLQKYAGLVPLTQMSTWAWQWPTLIKSNQRES